MKSDIGVFDRNHGWCWPFQGRIISIRCLHQLLHYDTWIRWIPRETEAAGGGAWAWFLPQLGLGLLLLHDRRFGFGWLALAAATFVHEFFASVEGAKARRVVAFVIEFGFLAVGWGLILSGMRRG